jgi:hypothetical protein
VATHDAADVVRSLHAWFSELRLTLRVLGER